MASIELQAGIRRMKINLDNLDRTVELRIAGAIEYQATVSEFFMKTRAPWTDRTGNARAGLFTATKKQGKRFSILLSHTAPYGIWLEVRWSGRYAVIVPALEEVVKELPARLRKVLG